MIRVNHPESYYDNRPSAVDYVREKPTEVLIIQEFRIGKISLFGADAYPHHLAKELGSWK